MGCPSQVYLEDNLTFTICTHDPTTGVLTDADSVPSYRVYETETDTAILSGNMTKLDDANTTGFYSETIACTAANGFENEKSYSIYISATVNTYTGGISYGFTAVTNPADIQWDEVIEGAITARQALRLLLSFIGGEVTGAGTTTTIFRDLADTKPRITMTLTAAGGRTAVTLDGS